MRLSRLVRALQGARVSGPVDIDIRDVAYDSRQVRPGALFVAVPTVGGDETTGGIRFAADAVQAGAPAVVVQRGQDVDGVTTVHVADARTALADLAGAFFEHPSSRLQLYAVTGTDGKTTTTYLLEQVLCAAGYVTGMLGTVETKIGEHRERNLDRMTTPESLDVQRLLRRMVDAGVTHAVMEASSHALALKRLRGCRFAACGLTNITADHIEFHGSWQRYFEAKASLFTELAPDRPAVLNRDDEHFEALAAMTSGPITTYSVERDADVRATSIAVTTNGTQFDLVTPTETARVSLTFPGIFNVSNALAAAGLALHAGVPLSTIARGLSQAQPPPGRFQRLDAGQPFEVVIDYAHTMHAFRSVLLTVRSRTQGRVIAVFGAAGNRDRAKRPVLAQIARQYADLSIVTNEDPFGESPEAIIDEILAGAPKEERGRIFVREPDRDAAIRRAVREAGPGDAVVILGKGHEQSIVVNGYKEPWSDSAAVRAAIEALA